MIHLGREVADRIVTNSYYDPSTGNIRERAAVDLTDLFEKNKAEKNAGNNGFTDDRGLRKIAELDMVTVHKLLTEEHIDVFKPEDMPRLKKWLKANPNFMTVHGGI